MTLWTMTTRDQNTSSSSRPAVGVYSVKMKFGIKHFTMFALANRRRCFSTENRTRKCRSSSMQQALSRRTSEQQESCDEVHALHVALHGQRREAGTRWAHLCFWEEDSQRTPSRVDAQRTMTESCAA